MKTSLFLALAILISLSVDAQVLRKGKKDAPAPDPKMDSLTAVNKNLSVANDSLSKASVAYFGVYTATKDKLIKKDFDPAQAAVLIDSALAPLVGININEDSVRNYFMTSFELVKSELTKTNQKLDSLTKASMPVESPESMQELERGDAVSKLKNLKELLDANVISQTEYLAAKKKYLPKL
jgi:hypothetical protein